MFNLLIQNGLTRRVNTEKKNYKANHFNTGPTTSGRHSNKYINKYIKPTISILGNKVGILQVVGTVKNIKLQSVPPSMPSEAL